MLDFRFWKIGICLFVLLALKLYDPQEAAGMFAFRSNVWGDFHGKVSMEYMRNQAISKGLISLASWRYCKRIGQ